MITPLPPRHPFPAVFSRIAGYGVKMALNFRAGRSVSSIAMAQSRAHPELGDSGPNGNAVDEAEIDPADFIGLKWLYLVKAQGGGHGSRRRRNT
jgi:hypothetical protein